MWQSEDDFLKDIASLNDFGDSDAKESYKILYSVGRGLKAKEKSQTVEKFIDSRTGEAINLENDACNICYKSKGRGSVLGSLFRTRLQLQQQLRLARPLGSGDEAIESYYGRSRSRDNVENSAETSDSESVAENPITSDEHNKLNSNIIRKRVKGTRNSGLTANALINSLLSKNKEEADVLKSEANDEQLHSSLYNNEKCDMYDKIGCSHKWPFNNLDFSNLTLSSKLNKKIDSVGKNLGNLKESTNRILHEKLNGDEVLKIIDDEELKKKLKKKTKKKNKNIHKIIQDFKFNINGFNCTELESDRDLKYKAPGEELNSLKEIRSNGTESGRYDLIGFSQYSVSTEPYVFLEEDFPPLRKS